MNISDDNTNELDSYGVWVKKSTDDKAAENQDKAEEIQTEDSSLDLPDFEDTDFSDMFKDDSQFSTESKVEETFSDDLDSTLSTDELANITGFGDVTLEEVDAPVTDTEDEGEQEINIDDFMTSDDSPAPAEENIETSDFVTEDISEPKATSDDGFEEVSFGDDEEISLDDFMDGGFSDESVAAGNNGYEAGSEPKVSSDSEELSLDDFMDGSSFDMAPPEAKPEEVIEDEPPLDMNLTFDDSADSVQTEDNISIDNDDSLTDDDDFETETIETEDVSLDDFGASFDSDVSANSSSDTTSSNISTEEVDLSDFGIDADAEETPITQDVEEQKSKEAVVDYDLSVGDENTSSAPVVNEIKNDAEADEKMAEVETAEPVEKVPENSTVVDNSLLQQIVADLSGLKDEINKLKENLEAIKTAEATPLASPLVAESTEIPVEEEPASEELNIAAEKDEGGFFSQSDGDDTIALSFDELDNIMNTAEFTEETADSQNEEKVEEVVDEPITEETVEEPVITESPVEEAFAEPEVASEPESLADDALVTESEEAVTEEYTEPLADETIVDETIVEENEEPVIEETAVDQAEIAEAAEDFAVEPEESVFETENSESPSEIPEPSEPTIEDSFETVETAFENEEITDDASAENEVEIEENPAEVATEEVSDQEITFDTVEEENPASDDLNFEFEDENLEEPNIEDISVDENAEDFEDEDLPSEISIPKDDDILVESNASDFMDSVKSDDDVEETGAFGSVNEDIPSELPADIIDDVEVETNPDEIVMDFDTAEEIQDSTTETAEEPLAEEIEEIPTTEPVVEDNSFETLDTIIEDVPEEPVAEDIASEEPVIEDVVAEEPVEEPVIEEAIVDDDSDDIPTVDKLLADAMETEETEETEAEPIFDQVMPENDEPVIEETSVTFEEEPMAVDVAPEAPVTEEPIVEK